MWFGHESLKGLSCSYDAAKDLLITFMMNWLLSMWNLGRPDFCRSYEPTGIRKEKKTRREIQAKWTKKRWVQKRIKDLSKKQETLRRVFFILRGKDVISLSYALEYLVNFAYYCTSLDEELKAEAPPETTLATYIS